jgi:hypothetical protein
MLKKPKQSLTKFEELAEVAKQTTKHKAIYDKANIKSLIPPLPPKLTREPTIYKVFKELVEHKPIAQSEKPPMIAIPIHKTGCKQCGYVHKKPDEADPKPIKFIKCAKCGIEYEAGEAAKHKQTQRHISIASLIDKLITADDADIAEIVNKL